jgi:DNA recombination protein RmuC
MMLIAVLVLLLPCMGLLAAIWRQIQRDQPDRTLLIQLQAREADWVQGQAQAAEIRREAEVLRIENAGLRRDLEHEHQQGAEKLQLLQNAEARLKTEFENLANRIFTAREQTGAEQQRLRLTATLEPFRQQLDDFRKRVEDVHRNETEQAGRLIEQVRQLQTLSNKVSEDANQLAQAIKGEAKRQGDWGEVVVERILEASGLSAGREFTTQMTVRSEAGIQQRPDFVLHLPGEKAVILDAKVSLTAYERYCHAEDEAARTTALKEHVASVRKHFEQLRERRYEDILGNRTLDFVIMCIPIEPAYQTAMQADPDLLYLQAQAPVVITGPSTLMITLKLIAQIWRRENENRNAEKIADRAGRMHDQIVLVYEAVAEAQQKLEAPAKALELALKRIKDGKGNLLGRADELRQLGAKVGKTLPAQIIAENEDIPTLPA